MTDCTPPLFGHYRPDTACTPRRAAYVVIVRNGRVAAVEDAGCYFLPGGGIEETETPTQAVLREIREEISCTGVVDASLGEAIQYFAADETYYRMHAYFFAGHLTGELADTGEHPLAWLSPEVFDSAFRHECHAWAARVFAA